MSLLLFESVGFYNAVLLTVLRIGFGRDTERKEQAEQDDAAELARITATPQWVDSPRHRPVRLFVWAFVDVRMGCLARRSRLALHLLFQESAVNTAHSFRLHTASSRKNLDSDEDDDDDAFADLSYGTSSSDDDEEYGK